MRFLLLFVVFSLAAEGRSARVDLLGAHANFSRGCSACHVESSPSFRNVDGHATNAPMLWGEDVASTYTTQYSDSSTASEASSPTTQGMLICLTCHGGNYAPSAMMKNTQYEKLPGTWAISSPPIFRETQGVTFEQNFSDHPVGDQAQLDCDGEQHWDCVVIRGKLSMAGPRSSQFAAHYGFFLRPVSDGGKSVIVCTTCHNPHSMNLTEVPPSAASDVYPAGFYPTRYYLRAPYGNKPSGNSNLSAQFCRQCHAELSNEMNGSTAGTIM